MTSSQKSTRVRFIKTRWFKISAGIIAAVALILLLLPFGAKYYLVGWLEDNGADRAVIEKLRYNPFTGSVTLGGVDVQGGNKSRLHHSSLVFDVGLISLFKRDIRLQRAEYRDMTIEIEQLKDGSWRFGSYTLQDGASEEVVIEDKEEVSVWGFLADQVELENCTIHLETPEIDLTLVVEKAELSGFTTRKSEQVGRFYLQGSLNDSRLKFDLDRVQVVPELLLAGDISVTDYNLEILDNLLRDVLPVFKGVVGLKGKLLFRQSSQDGMRVGYNGDIDIAGPEIGNNRFITQAKRLSWQGIADYHSATDSPMIIVTEGTLLADTYGLEVGGAQFGTTESKIELTGKNSVTISENVRVENEGVLLVEESHMNLPLFEINEKSLSWKGKVFYDSDHQGKGLNLKTDGDLALGEFLITGGSESAPLNAGWKKAGWQGTVELHEQTSGMGQVVQISGELGGEELHGTLVEPGFSFTQEMLQVESNSTISLGEVMDITGKSALHLDRFSLKQIGSEQPLLAVEKLGVVDLEGKGGKMLAAGGFEGSGIQALVPGNLPLRVDIPGVEVTGLRTEDLATFRADMFRLDSPNITATHNDGELLRLKSLAVKGVTAGEAGRLSADELQIDDLVFLRSEENPDKESVVQLGNGRLSAISWYGGEGLQADRLQIDGLNTRIIRDKEGTINISSKLQAMQANQDKPAKETPVTDDEEQGAGVPLRLSEIVVGGASSVVFEDYTLAVPYRTDLAISQLQMTDIDSTKPEQEINLLLKGDLEKRAPLEIAGTVSPFSDQLSMKMKLKLKNYPLSSLSAYTVQSVGTALASGQLKLKTKVELADGNLDMDNSILLKKLETETISPELAAELDNQLPVPLDAALSILRNSERNIELDIPLNGPLSDLDVGVSDVLITALSKAIVPAASGYLMYALGPYGALAYVGMKAGEKMLQVTLPPVLFVQQEVTLTAEHIDYLERVAKILTDRPDPDLQICPRVASWELVSEEEKTTVEGGDFPLDEEQRETLLELGQLRGMEIKKYLVEKHAIASDRLLICDTLIENRKDSQPAVLLQF
ncbi:MAG: DUF748 domain-containing protein [Desulforhopalus sp.]